MSNKLGEFAFLGELCQTPGVSGREERVRDLVRKRTDGFWDEVRTDDMGNLVCLKKAGKAPGRGAKTRSVMLACHMDEIGFYVRHIDSNGRLRVQNAGGFDVRNLYARRVLVQGREDLYGVLNPGGKPIHISTPEERNKIPTIQEFFVDLFLPKRQVDKLVSIGDPVTLVQDFAMIGDAVTGKCLDNRAAVWCGINAVRSACGMGYLGVDGESSSKSKRGARSKNGDNRLKYDVYFVACTQEEVGLRGAMAATFDIKPDIGVAIDVTLACDTPGVASEYAVTEFGKGAAIKWMDSSSISHHGLFEEFLACARKHRIRHQREVLTGGGTDAGALQRVAGSRPTITLSIPTRYIHTVTESIHKDDARAAVGLLAAWLTD